MHADRRGALERAMAALRAPEIPQIFREDEKEKSVWKIGPNRAEKPVRASHRPQRKFGQPDMFSFSRRPRGLRQALLNARHRLG